MKDYEQSRSRFAQSFFIQVLYVLAYTRPRYQVSILLLEVTGNKRLLFLCLITSNGSFTIQKLIKFLTWYFPSDSFSSLVSYRWSSLSRCRDRYTPVHLVPESPTNTLQSWAVDEQTQPREKSWQLGLYVVVNLFCICSELSLTEAALRSWLVELMLYIHCKQLRSCRDSIHIDPRQASPRQVNSTYMQLFFCCFFYSV